VVAAALAPRDDVVGDGWVVRVGEGATAEPADGRGGADIGGVSRVAAAAVLSFRLAGRVALDGQSRPVSSSGREINCAGETAIFNATIDLGPRCRCSRAPPPTWLQVS
jgi:hypothetical protein